MTQLTDKEIGELLAKAEAATPGKWLLATSNSWRRFVSIEHGSICEPIKQSDGHPDLHFRRHGKGSTYGPDAVFMESFDPPNAISLCKEVLSLRERVERLEAALTTIARYDVGLSDIQLEHEFEDTKEYYCAAFEHSLRWSTFKGDTARKALEDTDG